MKRILHNSQIIRLSIVIEYVTVSSDKISDQGTRLIDRNQSKNENRISKNIPRSNAMVVNVVTLILSSDTHGRIKLALTRTHALAYETISATTART